MQQLTIPISIRNWRCEIFRNWGCETMTTTSHFRYSTTVATVNNTGTTKAFSACPSFFSQRLFLAVGGWKLKIIEFSILSN
jgi:hypothetical protein